MVSSYAQMPIVGAFRGKQQSSSVTKPQPQQTINCVLALFLSLQFFSVLSCSRSCNRTRVQQWALSAHNPTPVHRLSFFAPLPTAAYRENLTKLTVLECFDPVPSQFGQSHSVFACHFSCFQHEIQNLTVHLLPNRFHSLTGATVTI